MSKGTSIMGITGGVLGIITSIAGFAWTASLMIFISDLMNYASIVNFIAGPPPFGASSYNGIVASLLVPYPATVNLFLMSSVIIAVLVVVFGASVGLGFRRLYLVSSGAVGSVYFAVSFIGTLVAGILIFIGGAFQTTIISQFLNLPGYMTILTPLRIPEFFYTWTGEMILGVALIVMGVASVRIRKSVEHRDTAMAAGILSIVGGVIFALHIIMAIPYSAELSFFWNLILLALTVPIGVSMTPAILQGVLFSFIFSLLGFGLLFVLSVLWTRMFLAPSSPK